MNIRLSFGAIVPLSISAGLVAVSSAQNPTAVRQRVGPPAPPKVARDPAGQISEYVREVFQDREGNLWLGTNGDGVCRYDGESLTYFGPEEGFGGVAVRGIVQAPDGAMWFATDGGVSRYESGSFANYTVADGLGDNGVWSILLDGAGSIWVGTHAGVCRFDGTSFAPFPLPRVEVENPESRFSPLVVFAMFEDRSGNLWFGTDGEGVHRYDGASFTSYTTRDGLAGNVVRAVRGDRHGRIWIGTNGGGVSCYDGTAFRNFTAKDGLNNDRVYEILEDSAGNMWFSTLGAGACRYDGTTFTPFGVDQGLIVNELPCPCGSGTAFGACHGPGGGHVQEIFEDRDGTLWFGCSGGLFRLDGESLVNVRRNGPWPTLTRGPAAEETGPMASFARMLSGEWRVTLRSGTSLVDRWTWGPGRHSMRVETRGSGPSGEPWRDLRVVYWHPRREQVRLLGVSPFARGVSEGSMAFDGETAEAVFDLHQTFGHRAMGLRWTFDGPDAYHETLLEATGPEGLQPLNELDFVRSRTLSATPPLTGETAPRPSEHLEAFESLVGTWEAAGDEGSSLESSFEWVPYADYVQVRSFARTGDGQRAHPLDAYVFHHTGTGTLRCLALSGSGGVHEGEVTVLDGGALQLDLESYEGERVGAHVVLLDLEQRGILRERVWSVEGAERTLLRDVRHRRVEPEDD